MRAVLLHGVGSCAGTWWRIAAGLAERGWDARALDLPGHGAAPAPDGPLVLDALVDSVDERLPAPVDLLVGHSLGAVVSLALAGRRPGVARALVLEDPPGLGAVDMTALADHIEEDAALAARDRTALLARERADNPLWAPEDVERAVEDVEQTDLASVAAGLRGPLRWDLLALLAAVEVPELVIAAPDAAGTFPQTLGTALRGTERAAVAARLPPGRFVVLDGGHCLHRDFPEDWLEVVDDFLAT